MFIPAAQAPTSPEIVFYESAEVKVTNLRFITGKQTFEMCEVNSVKSTRTKGPRIGLAVFLGLVASFWAMCFLYSLGGHSVLRTMFFGAVTALVAFTSIGYFRQRFEYNVVLTTSSGEVPALTSTDDALVSAVVTALNEALVHG